MNVPSLATFQAAIVLGDVDTSAKRTSSSIVKSSILMRLSMLYLHESFATNALNLGAMLYWIRHPWDITTRCMATFAQHRNAKSGRSSYCSKLHLVRLHILSLEDRRVGKKHQSLPRPPFWVLTTWTWDWEAEPKHGATFIPLNEGPLSRFLSFNIISLDCFKLLLPL